MLADADRPNIRKKFKRWELSSPGRGLALLGLVRLVGRWTHAAMILDGELI